MDGDLPNKEAVLIIYFLLTSFLYSALQLDSEQ